MREGETKDGSTKVAGPLGYTTFTAVKMPTSSILKMIPPTLQKQLLNKHPYSNSSQALPGILNFKNPCYYRKIKIVETKLSKMKKLLIYILSLSTLVACKKQINLDLQNSAAQIVIEGTVTN